MHKYVLQNAQLYFTHPRVKPWAKGITISR